MRELKTQDITIEAHGLVQVAYCEMHFEQIADFSHRIRPNVGSSHVVTTTAYLN